MSRIDFLRVPAAFLAALLLFSSDRTTNRILRLRNPNAADRTNVPNRPLRAAAESFRFREPGSEAARPFDVRFPEGRVTRRGGDFNAPGHLGRYVRVRFAGGATPVRFGRNRGGLGSEVWRDFPRLSPRGDPRAPAEPGAVG